MFVVFGPYLRGDDVEEVPGKGELLGEDVVVIGLEGDAQRADDEGAGREKERRTVLPQEGLQLGRLLTQQLQRHLGAWQPQQLRGRLGSHRTNNSP